MKKGLIEILQFLKNNNYKIVVASSSYESKFINKKLEVTICNFKF